MKQADKVVIEKMIGYSDDIISAMDRFGAAKESYDKDKVYQYATSMCILQIGELANRLSDEAKTGNLTNPLAVDSRYAECVCP